MNQWFRKKARDCFMGISGIAGSSMYSSVSTLKSFQQLNRDVDSQGVAQASRISKAAGDY